MKYKESFFVAGDGSRIFYKEYFPETDAKAVVLIFHGMAEHSGRYSEFIKYLCENGYAVYIHDQRGHGKTAGSLSDYGYLGKPFSWEKLSDDANILNEIAVKENSGKKIIIIGHSAGSMIARRYIEKYSQNYSGVILSGANGIPFLSEIAAFKIALFQTLAFGVRHRSKILFFLQFGSYNMHFKERPTMFEWLSRDRERVDDYVNDPYCGGVFTASFFLDMLWGYFKFAQKNEIKKIRKDIPILFISGEDDPVGNFTKGVRQFADLYKKCGLNDIEVKFYTECRHEILNELNRNEIYKDIVDWINIIINKKQK